MAVDYEIRYQMAGIAARNDGSTCVQHDIWAWARAEGGEWEIVPGRHESVNVPAEVLLAAMAEPTTPAKGAAYKQALIDWLGVQPNPITGWGRAKLIELMQNNDAAEAAHAAAYEFITETLGWTFPDVYFTI